MNYQKGDLVRVVGSEEIPPHIVCDFMWDSISNICEIKPIDERVFDAWYSEGLFINGKVYRKALPFKLFSFFEGNYEVLRSQLRPVELQSNERFVLTEIIF